ncbi:uncharacterized protein FOMMEDRAFT_159715 [Fomitiporia mediterranea MF3/22]|uniref:uncharacterized protein n=1 Tax=Fomitiporia mediterranea (strain MF3/22) TaxID=694068 RepID=UPI0004409CC8|nr:uncharacterized protein FOMMEDRAFT_159715 [Fomitiporia mediterranea MF3/22]EJD00103.1 hypothetical protein FOMMEDRAFT_159715 [Fomitiporia mediterranea MF3/22]
MSAQAPVPAINLDITLGALLVGSYISCTLFGFTCLQTYNYYTNYSDDRYFLKTFVACIWILEFVHTIFVTRTFYEMGVTNFGSFADFLELPFVLKFSIVWSNSVACSVQAFFANRIRVMSGRWELSILCWTLSVLRYVASLVATAEEIKIKNQVAFNAKFKWIIVLVLAVGAVNDVLIAAGLSLYLSKSRSGIKTTDRIVNRLIKFTIQSGLLTSVVATAMLICYLTMPDNFIWLALFVFLAKTYSNSFLATLNARKSLRSHFGSRDNGHSAVAFTSVNGSFGTGQASTTRQNTSNVSNSLQPKSKKHQPIAIEMTNVTTTSSDDDYAKGIHSDNSFLDTGHARSERTFYPI